MLVGRESERLRIERLLADARHGRSGVLVVRGEPGIGKSALLDDAVERASDTTILSARGVDSESEVPFAGLFSLLRPARHRIDELDPPQRAALASALAFGPAQGGDRFTIGVATLSLLALIAEEAPLLVVIDDVHALDRPTQEALAFAARRLEADRTAVLLTERIDGPTSLFGAGLPTLVLEGLDHEAARSLLRARSAQPIAAHVETRLIDASRGNPLALTEFATALAPAQLAGSEPLPEPLPVGPLIQISFGRRIQRLGESCQRALLVAAAAGTADLAPIVGATRLLGIDADVFETAEAAGLIVLEEGQLRFHHPLVRSAAYYAAVPTARRAAHAALAEALQDPSSIDERAWHLAHAAVGPDETVAALLESAGERALERGGPIAAARAFERAAQLSLGAELGARRMLRAAENLVMAGSAERARELLDHAIAHAADSGLRADIEHVRGRITMFAGPIGAAYGILASEAARIEPTDPIKASAMFADAARAAALAADLTGAISAARRAVALTADQPSTAVGRRGRLVLSQVLAITGSPRAQLPMPDGWGQSLLEQDLSTAIREVELVGAWFSWAHEPAATEHVLTHAVNEARRAGAPGALPLRLALRADLLYRLGRWVEATADAAEALELARHAGQQGWVPYALMLLARTEASQGRSALAHEHASQSIELSRPLGLVLIPAYAASSLALLDLGLGNTAEAIDRLESPTVNGLPWQVAEPSVVSWGSDLIEAYIRAGRTAEAARALDQLTETAGRSGRPWGLAVAARCRGLLASEADFDASFVEALGWHERVIAPFDRARTQLCYGELLRRHHRSGEAQAPLHAAVDTFERLAAIPWAERAKRELQAMGARHRGSVASLYDLTPQEAQVALLISRGLTNKEAASALFVSPKTIEFHLGTIYGKLGLRSRTELASLISREGIGGATMATVASR